MRAIDLQLFRAIKEYNPLAVRHALNNGANVNVIAEGLDAEELECDGDNPVYLAVAVHAPKEILQLLVDAGANVNIRGKHKQNTGKTALCRVGAYGLPDSGQILIKAGAEVDSPDKFGQTPLFLAVKYGFSEMVELLIKSGASLDKASNNGRTPAHELAFKSPHPDRTRKIKLFVEAWANLDIPDNKGKTALDYMAEDKCPSDFVKLVMGNVSSSVILSALDSFKKQKNSRVSAFLLLSTDKKFSTEERKTLEKLFIKNSSDAICTALSFPDFLEIPVNPAKFFNAVGSGKKIKLNNNQAQNLLELAIRFISKNPDCIDIATKSIANFSIPDDSSLVKLSEKFARLIVRQNADTILEESCEYIEPTI